MGTTICERLGGRKVGLYADGEFIEEQHISNLSAGSNQTLVFEWAPAGMDEQDGGDVTGNNVVNTGDVILLANYVGYPEYSLKCR